MQQGLALLEQLVISGSIVSETGVFSSSSRVITGIIAMHKPFWRRYSSQRHRKQRREQTMNRLLYALLFMGIFVAVPPVHSADCSK